MKESRITFRIVFNDDDTIDAVTAKLHGSIDSVLFAKILDSVSKVRDEYNMEMKEE